jgi:plastocyanin
MISIMTVRAMIAFLPLVTVVFAAGVDPVEKSATYLPNSQDSKTVTVTTAGQAATRVVVQTQAVAIKENGPRETVAAYGEVYAFAPATIIVHRDQATQIDFWNLQGDDDHDFMLMDSHWAVLMKVLLPALRKTSFVFTFHQEGLFTFMCAMHQPAMSGQILVLPPVAARPRG